MASTTTRGAFPYPGSTDPDNVPADLQALATQLAAVGVLYGQGAASGRPAAAAARAGMIYASTDTGAVDYCTGTTWIALVQAPGSTNADTLDGLDSTAFLRTTGKAADADKLDGIDSTTFARKDQANTFAGSVSASGLYDFGNRAYSASNPPPVSGAVIVQTIRGNVVMNSPGTVTNVTIPSVNMAKAQVRNLGTAPPGSSSTSGLSAGMQLTSSTNLQIVGAGPSAGNVAYYEITEWS